MTPDLCVSAESEEVDRGQKKYSRDTISSQASQSETMKF